MRSRSCSRKRAPTVLLAARLVWSCARSSASCCTSGLPPRSSRITRSAAKHNQHESLGHVDKLQQRLII